MVLMQVNSVDPCQSQAGEAMGPNAKLNLRRAVRAQGRKGIKAPPSLMS